MAERINLGGSISPENPGTGEASFGQYVAVGIECSESTIFVLKNERGSSVSYVVLRDLETGLLTKRDFNSNSSYVVSFTYGNSSKGYEICIYDYNDKLLGCRGITAKNVACSCIKDPRLVLVCIDGKMIARFSCSDRCGDKCRIWFRGSINITPHGPKGSSSELYIDKDFILCQPADIEIDLGPRGTLTTIHAGLEIHSSNPKDRNLGQGLGNDVRTERADNCWYYLGEYKAPCVGEKEGEEIFAKQG